LGIGHDYSRIKALVSTISFEKALSVLLIVIGCPNSHYSRMGRSILSENI